MKKFVTAYVPIGVGTFCIESAQVQYTASCRLIRSLEPDAVCPEKILLEIKELVEYLEQISPDLIILQNTTFANAAYTEEVLKRMEQIPILLWTLREPVIDGTRLRLNSLTGAYSAGNAMKRFGRNDFLYVFGLPKEEQTARQIGAAMAAARMKYELKNLKLLTVGHTPQGFEFGNAVHTDMMRYFGVEQEAVETRQLIARARSYSEETVQEYKKRAEEIIVGLEEISSENVMDFARLWRAYDTYVKERGIGAVASRCWPDYFTEFGTPVCAVLAMLNDSGVAASCEADSYGALSMYIAQKLTGKPSFFGDPVSVDEERNTFTFWHCGTAACSLARKDTGACAGIHCNRKIGPTLEFGCRPFGRVTIFRIGQRPEGGFRICAVTGEALDLPKQFFGTSMVVKIDRKVREVLEATIKDGWEPHFVAAYGDIALELKNLAELLHIELCEY